MRSLRGALLVLMGTLVLAGCGGGSSTTTSTGAGGASGTAVATPQPAITPFASAAVILKEPTSDATFRLADGTPVVAASDELLLEVEEDVTAEEMAAIEKAIADRGGVIVGQVPGSHLLELQFPASSDLVALDDAFSALPGVAGADLNELVTADQAAAPAPQAALLDPVAALLASAIPTVPTFAGDYWIGQVEAVAGWNLLASYGSPIGPLIGTADGGFDFSLKVIESSRVTAFDSAGVPITEDCDVDIMHGSKVAGCAAGNGGSGVYGMSWSSPVVAVKCLGKKSDGYTLNTSAAIETAVRKQARVVNVSIGAVTTGLTSDAAFYRARQRFRDRLTGALDFARRNNVLVCFSAGNDGNGNRDYTDPIKHDDQLLPTDSRSSIGSWNSHALIVANSTSDRTIAPSSREGKVVNLAAPGTSVGINLAFDGKTTFSGTSYSTPFTSGVAAAVISMASALTPPEVRAVILDTLDPNLTSVNNALGLLNYRRAATSGLSFRNVPTGTALTASLTRNQTRTLDVALSAGKPAALDVLFLVDVSKTNAPSLAGLKAAAPKMLAAIRARVPDTQFAVSSFADYPITPYGASGDNAWKAGCTFTTDDATLKSAFNGLATQDGGDASNSQWSALQMSASGSGLQVNGSSASEGAVPPQLIGYRGAAMKVVVLVTCTPFHDRDSEPDYPGSGQSAVVSLLKQRGFSLIGVQTDNPVGDLDTAVSRVGGQVVDSAAATDIDAKVATALDTMLANVTLSLVAVGDPEGFVSGISPASFAGVPSGQARTFKVALSGRKRASVTPQQYPSVLWGVVNGSGVVARIPLTVWVPEE